MGKNGKHRFLGKSTGGFFELYESTGQQVFFGGGSADESDRSDESDWSDKSDGSDGRKPY